MAGEDSGSAEPLVKDKAETEKSTTTTKSSVSTPEARSGNGAANGVVNGGAAAVAASRQNTEANLVLLVGCCAVTALAVAAVSQSKVLEGGDFSLWFASLFQDHYVAPPAVSDRVCTIQFCQS